MPREHRKRGKKNKKKLAEEGGPQEVLPARPELDAEPSWMRSAPTQSSETNPEAPFGYVDADVKAYFRSVDVQIRDWQDENHQGPSLDGDVDSNEERRLFFVAALAEMEGKELQLATDPDCSVVLERMAYSMDDFVRRVFMDRLAGSLESLVRHRFASHVCQTLFTVAKESVARETREVFPDVSQFSEAGELRTLTQLILDASEELLPTFTSLIMDPFGSHVIRALLVLLSPSLSPSYNDSKHTLRSKKSAVWKAKQGQMKSVFMDEKGKEKKLPSKSTPPEFRTLARRFVEILRNELGENEVRALAANKAASPCLQILLEVEVDQGMASDPGSLMDRVTVGIITACHDDPNPDLQPSDYLNTLLRDPTSSHLLETIVMHSPSNAFVVLWSTYFKGKLTRLVVHPVANFVLAKAFERVSADQLSEACIELDGSWSRMISLSRTGVLRAFIDRCATLHTSEADIVEAVYAAFGLTVPEDRSLLVPCVLHLLPLQEYKTSLAASSTPSDETRPAKERSRPGLNNTMEPKIQGSLLLQSLLRLSDPYNQVVIANIASLPIEERIRLARSASGSRIYDALFDSPTVPSKAKRQFVMELIGHYDLLVDDRLGSRIADCCWSFADTYLKEKIARSLIVKQQFLAGSYYGRFFARKLNLHLLERRPDEWKTLQADRKRLQDQASSSTTPPPPSSAALPPEPTLRKRKAQPEDEIDAVFNASLGKRVKKATLGGDVTTARTPTTVKEVLSNPKRDLAGLQDVLSAIRVAPKDQKTRRREKRQ